MLALFGQAFDNATGGCFRRSDEICSEAPPVCTALIWKFGDEVESHVSCRSAGLWPHFCLCSAACLVRSHHTGLIRVIEYSWGQNNHLTEKWEIHSFHWETWSSQMHILETPDCTLTHTHTVILIILEIHTHLNTVKSRRGFLWNLWNLRSF